MGNLAKTAVGLFQDSGTADKAARALPVAALASGDIRVLSEVADIPTRDVLTSRARILKSHWGRDLAARGASEALGIMNRNGAGGSGEVGGDAQLPGAARRAAAPDRDTTELTGRSLSPAGEA